MIKHFFTLLMTLVSGLVIAQQDTNAVVVMELFTSQGCSSCPPADELLEVIKKEYKEDRVFVLSYHVDYWNRLGWKDPFSDIAYSDYQRDYAKQFNSRSIYTPQLVVNGSEHFTGSSAAQAQNALKKYGKSKATNTIILDNIKQENSRIVLDYEVRGTEFETITLVLVVSERTTAIGRGENRNRTLKNTNIVANRLVQEKESSRVVLEIPDWIDVEDKLSIIAYTQNTSLKTTGATEVQVSEEVN